MVEKEEKEEDQQRFLDAYAEEGSLLAARLVTGITRWRYRQWVIEDPGFSKRIDDAKGDFGESLEALALHRVRNPDKSRGSDVLLIGLLNANLPHKYRPSQAMDTDAAKELIVEWRKAAKQAKESGEGKDGADEELSAPIERTLIEILANRGGGEKEKGMEGDEVTS